MALASIREALFQLFILGKTAVSQLETESGFEVFTQLSGHQSMDQIPVYSLCLYELGSTDRIQMNIPEPVVEIITVRSKAKLSYGTS